MPGARILLAPVALLLLAAMTIQDGASSARSALTAPQILEEMAKRYRECESYRDTGVVDAAFMPLAIAGVVHPTPDQATQVSRFTQSFSTAFVRGRGLRFQCTVPTGGSQPYFILSWDGSTTTTWSAHHQEVQEKPSPGFAIGAATGASGGAAFAVTRMLLPDEVQGTALTDLTDVERLADETLDGHPCFCIKGKMDALVDTIWIDQESLLLRRKDREVRSSSAFGRVTMTFAPESNVVVSSAELALDPPEPK